MLQLLKEFLNDVGIGEKPASRFSESDYRLAAAALLIHVMSVDDAVDELIAAATAADREAVDLYSFTSLINRSLDEDGRRRIVKMMWEIVYADGRMNEFEDNIVWRASDLLGISQRDRVEMRLEVAEALKSRDDA
jgi:uncharacterized tellurite resistance protein B-like protein